MVASRKISISISLNSADNAIQAVGYADQIGRPLNRFVTIDWQLAQCLGRFQDVQGKFFERFSKWARYRNFGVAYVWALENSRDIGIHSHILIHVPSHHLIDFKRIVPKWIDGDVDQSGATKTFKIQTVKYHSGADRLNPVKKATKYLLKGISDQARQILTPIEDRGPQGVIVGRRCGTSESIGRTARKAA